MTDQTHILAIDFDAKDTVKLYIDGELVASPRASEGKGLDVIFTPGPTLTWRRRLRGHPLRMDYIPGGRPLSRRWWQWRRIRWLAKELWWTFWS